MQARHEGGKVPQGEISGYALVEDSQSREDRSRFVLPRFVAGGGYAPAVVVIWVAGNGALQSRRGVVGFGVDGGFVVGWAAVESQAGQGDRATQG
ncbi:hypothetical protein Acor_72790 [Acrocarpospora corrugata]|uniref:Uncharacterized protein n=1 Tax=Acrocarpospora corrugata TaxID=35763 RepID=A0A5M3WDQ6_9ACTN|nr:hypothetical protein Acor_72790 [Acrocarpospora corrugata]